MRIEGYDGSTIRKGDRVEIHPGTDLWMQGARYGTVTSIRNTPAVAHGHHVHVEMDKVPGRTFSGTGDTFRLIS